MIKEIKLENWKSFEKSVLFVDPLTILIGTNGSGKSNILDAFSFLHGISRGKTLTSVVNGDQENEGIRGGSEWIINKQANSTSLSVVISTEHENLVEYVYSISLGITDDQRVELLAESLIRQRKAKNGNITSTKKLFYTNSDNLSDPSIITYFYSSTSGRGKRLDLRRTYSILSQSKSLALLKEVQIGINAVSSVLSGVFVLDPIPANMRRYSRISDKLLADASNIAGVIAGHSVNGSTGQLERAIRKYLAVLPENDIQRIWAEKVGRFEIDAMLYCDEILVAGSGLSTHYVNASTQPSLMNQVKDREESHD